MDPKYGPPPVETVSSTVHDSVYHPAPPGPSQASAPPAFSSTQSSSHQGPGPAYPPPLQPPFPPPAYQQRPAGHPPQTGPPTLAGQSPGYYPKQYYVQPQQSYYSHGQAPPPPGQVSMTPSLYPQQRITPGAVTVVTTRPGIVRNPYGPNPRSMQCPHCHANITTATTPQMGTMVWVVFGGILLFGLFVFPFILLGCCFIPFCIPSLKDVEHSCPNCAKFLGKYKRMR